MSTQSSGWLSVSIGLDEFSTIAVLALTFGSYFALYYACKPLNWWKSLMLAGVLVLVLLGIFALPWFFGYVRLNGVEILLLVSSVLISFRYSNSICGLSQKSSTPQADLSGV
ncbi:MAG: hypothetical protein ACLU1U_00055 [Lachnospiraceae bacterium]